MELIQSTANPAMLHKIPYSVSSLFMYLLFVNSCLTGHVYAPVKKTNYSIIKVQKLTLNLLSYMMVTIKKTPTLSKD